MPRASPKSVLPPALVLTLTGVLMGGCAGVARVGQIGGIQPRPGASFADIGYSTWGPQEPAYRLYPGDILDVAFPSAPELNREVTVQPDGRISLPLVQPVMAADLSVTDLQGALSQSYAGVLVRPEVDVAVRTAAPLRIFVGGEVSRPGVYDMPGDIDALQAVTMAGGFLETARRRDVIVIRRGPGGRPMMRVADLRAATFDPAGHDAVALRRFDVVYVPKTPIANADIFVAQYIRDLVPVSFSYALSGGLYGTTP